MLSLILMYSCFNDLYTSLKFVTLAISNTAIVASCHLKFFLSSLSILFNLSHISKYKNNSNGIVALFPKSAPPI